MPKDLLHLFGKWIEELIHENSTYLSPLVCKSEDEQIHYSLLNLKPWQVYGRVYSELTKANTKELIFGFSRSAALEQGTEFPDVFACAQWLPDSGWEPFIINYQREPQIVRPPNFHNVYWGWMTSTELASSLTNSIRGNSKGT